MPDPTSSPPLEGLVAATFTPMQPDGQLDLDAIAPMVDRLAALDISALYVLGSTGEGLSLAARERRDAADAFVRASAGRLPVIVQVGCECLAEARELAAHAQQAGADAVSAVSPTYFKPATDEALADSMAVVAGGAPELPFYYYHIPALTGVRPDLDEFLELARSRIPTMRGIKFSDTDTAAFRACRQFDGGRFDILWGVDERLTDGLGAGARGAVGSTYNFAAPLFHRLFKAFGAGDSGLAETCQARARAMVDTFVKFGARPAQKAIMTMVGADCGPVRLPLQALDAPSFAALEAELRELGFFDWVRGATSAPGA